LPIEGFSEDDLSESPALAELGWLGWETGNLWQEFASGASTEGRSSRADPVLPNRFHAALTQLNPGLPEEALQQAASEFVRDRTGMVDAEASREIYDLLKNGCKVRFQGKDGKTAHGTVRFIDWRDTDGTKNNYFVAQQVWMKSELYDTRLDAIGYVNGIPLVIFEFKKPSDTVESAYTDNLRHYRTNLRSLFHYNAFCILSNTLKAKVGSGYAPWEHFFDWKKINNEGEEGLVSLSTAIQGTCATSRLLDIVENFILYTTKEGKLTKILAKNHQFLGVSRALDKVRAIKEQDGKLGVFWHTQGSGKSFSMVFFGQKIHRTLPGNWTFIIVTDRDDLDGQIYKTFARSGAVTEPEESCRAQSREHLKELLRGDHRYLFTLIQKFGQSKEEKGKPYPKLTDRDDIIVITDEAHRSQYDTFAKNMRDAMPNASFIGFTGTPLIDGEDQVTRDVFGDYVSTYNFSDAVIDGATVPLFYENRIPELQLTNENLNDDLNDILENAVLDETQEQKLHSEFGAQYQLITRPDRLDSIASDMVDHFLGRGYRGKAMMIAIDKATAIKVYDKVRASWDVRIKTLEAKLKAGTDNEAEDLKAEIDYMRSVDMAVVVSPGQNEADDMKAKGVDITPHRKRMRSEDLEEKFKNPDDPLSIVFVCAMWITGFDAPCVSTIYLDKPMRNHSLMQTIARANRVMEGKEAGLVVDYIGVLNNLNRALSVYAKPKISDLAKKAADAPIKDKAELVTLLKDAVESLDSYALERGVDIADFAKAHGYERAKLLGDAAEALLESEGTKKHFISKASTIARAYKATLPDPIANELAPRVLAFAAIAEMLRGGQKPVDISHVRDEIEDLLNRSIATRGYLINKKPEEETFDLSAIDFEKLATQFQSGHKRTQLEKLKNALMNQVERMVSENRMRADLLDKLKALIEDYNSGSRNVEETYKRLLEFARTLGEEDKRHIREELSREELALFDILTKPEPQLTSAQEKEVKAIARELLAKLKKEKLILDWKKKERAKAAVRQCIEVELDKLPKVYTDDIWKRKCEGAFGYVYESL
jgi:type I restriction enzyme, R subunit